MEFISNLIKRPISLVLSDTVDVSAASPTNSNNSNSNSPSGAQLRERFSPIISNNNNSNGGNNNAHNMLKNNNNNKTSMNCRNSPTIPDLVHEANRNAILPLIVDVGAGGDGLHTGHCDFEHAQQLNSSASSNSTSSTIEELLIQINDNLNQATLQNQSGQAVGSPETLSGIAALTSPLGVKSSSSNKLSQSPNLQTPITPTVFNASPLPNVAAGSAVIDLNALKINSDAVAGKLDKTQLILNNNNTGVTKKNKFVGLTEFDESKIPELPESLNTNIGEQLKLTFDEDLIPTLTASTNTQLNLPNKKVILNPSDFDYLLTKGNNNVQVDRSSLLLRFDPLLGVPIPVNQPQQQQQQLQQILANSNNTSPYLCPTIEEDEQQHHNDNNRSFVVESAVASAKQLPKVNGKQSSAQGTTAVQGRQQLDISQEQVKAKKNVRMSVDVIKDMKIENDCNKAIENSNTQSDDTENNIKMDELEKKIKNEVLKTEDIEKKLKEAEQREEALIKRITEKDKKIAKMNDVIEAYEKAIAELISEKEQLIQNYEKQLTEVKADRDSNYHHLTSLETTFSDLHVKYEKSKEMTSQLKASEESLLAEKKQNLEGLRLQEQRYEKMKNHAMQQLEIANKKLESLTKEHAIELTKLKASLKKEEISRASINEQLQQKSRENAELVKICDELINGQGS